MLLGLQLLCFLALNQTPVYTARPWIRS